MRAAKNADQKFVIVNPLTISDTNQNIRALMIKVNKPSVSMLIGKVRMIMSGRMTAFTSPKTNATINAVKKLVISTPGTK